MIKRHSWFIVIAIVALLVAACAPQELATPATVDEETSQATTAPTEMSPLTSSPEPPSSDEYPVDEDDWHVLGAPDAPVTMFEFSDFQ